MDSIRNSLQARPEDDVVLLDFARRHGVRIASPAARAAAKTPAPAPVAAPAAAAAGANGELFPSEVPPSEYETVLTLEQLDVWLARIKAAALTAFDTETTSLDQLQAQLVGISLSVQPGQACYIPLAHNYAGAPQQLGRELVLERMRDWLEGEQYPKLGQNLKYDAHVLANQGVTLRGIRHDTLLQSYVLESHKPHDMDSLALRHLNRKTIKYEDVCGKGAQQIGFDQVDLERATAYAAEDADITLQLHLALWPKLEHERKPDTEGHGCGLRYVYEEIELPTAQVLLTMERNGVLIDADELARQSQHLGETILSLEQKAYEIAGQPFNLNSPKQLGELLFGKLQLPVVKKTPTGTPSTDEEVLQKLAEDFPLPKVLLEYRGLAKLKSTYTDKLPKMVNPHTGRVHTNYAQAVAVTGRLASNDPNLQNIPIRTAEGRRIRTAFVAGPGMHIVSADYSQIELRIMAHISQDANMLRAFADGIDIHRATAAEVFGIAPEQVSSDQRRYAKVINFGLIYGMGVFGLAQAMGVEREAAKSYIDRYFQRFAGVHQYMEDTRREAKTRGYVETVFGRRLWLPEINSPNGPRRAGAERAAINAPMQGTAADLIKLAMRAVQNWLQQQQLQSRMVMQVHDELVLEVPEAELALVRAELPRLMAGVASLRVPLLAEVGVGANWDEAH